MSGFATANLLSQPTCKPFLDGRHVAARAFLENDDGSLDQSLERRVLGGNFRLAHCLGLVFLGCRKG